jgi:hypothetical protein
LLSLLESTSPAERRSVLSPPVDQGRRAVVFLDVAEVDWIEAADYYVQLTSAARATSTA